MVLSTDSSKSGNAQVDATVAAVVLDAEDRIVAAKIDVAQCKMDVSEGRIDLEKEFFTKTELGNDYGMRRYSPIEKEWYEQAWNFAVFCVGKTAGDLLATETRTEESGHVVFADQELYAGCSIDIRGMLEVVVKAADKAAF